MRNSILQSSLVFGLLYAISIFIAPSLEVVTVNNSAKLEYSSTFRLMVFSVLAFLFYLRKKKISKFDDGTKMSLVLSIIVMTVAVDFLGWYFIGIYEYNGIGSFISIYLITMPMLGGLAFFVSAFIAEFIWKIVKTH